jgi:Fanconi anemia group I protein
MSRCTKSLSGNVVIEEPLDALMSCVSSILLLQPQGKADCPDSSRPYFGFSLSQENEVSPFSIELVIAISLKCDHCR